MLRRSELTVNDILSVLGSPKPCASDSGYSTADIASALGYSTNERTRIYIKSLISEGYLTVRRVPVTNLVGVTCLYPRFFFTEKAYAEADKLSGSAPVCKKAKKKK